MQFLVRKLSIPVLLLIVGVAYDGVKHDDLLYRFKDHGVHDAVKGNSAEFALYDTMEAYADKDDKEGCDGIGWNVSSPPETQEEIDEIGVCFSAAQADITCSDVSDWTNESSNPVSSDQRLIACTAYVWNAGASNLNVSPNDFTLVSNQGARITPDANNHDDVLDSDAFVQTDIAADESALGEIYFLTPSSVTLPFLVEWDPEFEDEEAKGIFIVDELYPLPAEE
jgi:hypothetical protein